MHVLPLLFLAVLPGCKPKEVAPPSIEVSTETLDFGEVPINAPATQEFTVQNTGGGEIELLSISVIEGSAAVWAVSRDSVSVLAEGESTTVSVTFTPSALLPYEGRIQVRSDDETNPNLYVALAGTGAESTADNDGDGYSVAAGDCNDNDAGAYPGATEICNGRDDDCNGAVPANELDLDGDGWLVCEGDCDDNDGNVYPDAPEICDDKDSDCDGTNADRSDRDGDGYTVCDDDCDDEEPAAWPGNPEICDEVDNDCDGDIDTIDVDRDGHSVCGAAGDCDDNDASAYPVVVDDDGGGAGDGTEENPYGDLETGLANLDRVCRTVQLNPGDYEVSITWNVGRVRIGGGGIDPSEVVVTAPAGSRMFEVSDGASLTLAGLTLTGGSPTSGDGGAVRVVSADLTLEEVVFDGNATAGDGGAVAVSSGDLVSTDCTFTNNLAGDDGGAVAMVSGSFSDTNSRYEGNTGIRGGALQLDSCVVDMLGSQVLTNVATDEGGGLELIGGAGVALQNLYFYDNTAGATGGGISAVNLVTDGYLRNLLIRDNQSGNLGGGIAFTGSAAGIMVANNEIVSNTSGGEGAGIAVDTTDAAGLYLWSNLVVWSDGDSGLWCRDGNGASVAYNTAYASTSGVDFDLGVGEDGGENEVADPLFRAYTNDDVPEGDDFALTGSSPARNSGPTDGSGPSNYSTWADLDGSRNDRGYTGGPGADP